ncbi:MAG: SIMPL domain-containing protein [Thermomonas sp.]|uniref:SIMPL domain-containing protein n=1 Tax=Thermomonas sp. TaxID=1971895 RepID=UPI002602E6FE|nr:SIMPL domain-containing protein [Thermomonas sp.]MCC7096746.1 SIMPL domain-containing protein [Thermomonas sp.]
MKNTLLALLLLLYAPCVFAQDVSGPPFIAVHGEAKLEVVPDIFPVTVTLQETSLETTQTQARIEGLAKELLRLANAQGVPDADMQVGNLDISPETDYDERTQRQVFLGNTYERVLTFRFHTLEALRQFISKAPTGRQVRLRTDNFEYSDKAAEQKKLLSAAIADARTTADEMARGVGMRIVGVQTISNQGLNIRYSNSSNETLLGTVSVSGSALLAPGIVLARGTIILKQDVYIVYLLDK